MTYDELIDYAEWKQQASCRGIDPRLFFPKHGEAVWAPNYWDDPRRRAGEGAPP